MSTSSMGISLRPPFPQAKPRALFLTRIYLGEKTSSNENNQDYFNGNASTGSYVGFVSIRAATTHGGGSQTLARSPRISRESCS
jgi:hypothetical protein